MMRFLLGLALLLPLSVQAFYQAQYDEGSLEIRGLVETLGLAANNPNDELLYPDDKILGAALSGRLMLDIDWPHWQFEAHAVQGYQSDELQLSGRGYRSIRDVERSDVFTTRFASDDATLLLDRFNLQYGKGPLNLKIGRQPVNLASTFYFTPNDFFAPFAAQTFYRTYKPGVDAARVDWQWSALSQLTLLAVLDYHADANTDTGWKKSPDWGNTAFLARASTLVGNNQWGLLAAEIDNDQIIGFDLQGEVFGWLGIRAEGHMRFFDEADRERDSKLSLSFEYRPSSRSSLRLEQFYQRSGFTDEEDYDLDLLDLNTSQFYLARYYTALGGSYEVTPLLNTNAVLLYNHNDNSSLIALYATYSLSDESELAVGINLPVGDLPERGELESEFGTYPKSLTVEIRSYF